MNKKVLEDPFGNELCLILYLYTMEPPLYLELNKSIKDWDKEKFKYLGPFARDLN